MVSSRLNSSGVYWIRGWRLSQTCPVISVPWRLNHRYKDRWCWCSMVSRLMACFMGLMFKPHQRCDDPDSGHLHHGSCQICTVRQPASRQASCCYDIHRYPRIVILKFAAAHTFVTLSEATNSHLCGKETCKATLVGFPAWNHHCWYLVWQSLFRSCFEGWDFHICLSDHPFVAGENYWKLLIGANRNKTSTVGEM